MKVVWSKDKESQLIDLDIFSTDDWLSRLFRQVESSEKYKNYIVLLVGEFRITDDIINECIERFGKPDVVVQSFFPKIEFNTDIPIYGVSNFFRLFVGKFTTVDVIESENITTQQTFNFMSNRKRINRFLMIKILEYFNLIKHAKYTWSGIGVDYDLSEILLELDSITQPWAQEIRSSILGSVSITPNWVTVDSDMLTPKLRIETADWITIWQAGLNQLFSSSAVSLITESVDYQAGIGFTEKSIYPVLGLTMPIWIGGKFQAEQFEKFGFDVFSDYIDHSYQYCDTLIERCYRAIADNCRILSDLDYAANIRNQVMPRLIKNRQLLLDVAKNPQLQYQQIVDSIAQLNDPPEFVKTILEQRARLAFNSN